eukprot:TRINITY_DN48290_c0_g1_i1.p1 TRINITY_DN48290_c0_g1~~TRINITY_DN48290_c0_g1_i1.p1  ORF type:complete len:795 (+),score=157.79 TRINITY_DN48290_c0_g1_i1:23-2386(+)
MTAVKLAQDMQWQAGVRLFLKHEEAQRKKEGMERTERVKQLARIAKSGPLEQLRGLLQAFLSSSAASTVGGKAHGEGAAGAADSISDGPWGNGLLPLNRHAKSERLPLHMAAARIDESRKSLAGAGPDDEGSASALEACKILIEEASMPVMIVDDQKRTAIFEAAKYGNASVIAYLPQKGCEVTALDKDGKSALFEAAFYNRPNCVKALLEIKAEVDTIDLDQQTPLFYAAESGSKESVELLLRASATVDFEDTLRQRPIFYAAKQAPGALKVLIDAKACVNRIDSQGRPPLYYAVNEPCAEAAMMLLDHGAWAASSSGSSGTVGGAGSAGGTPAIGKGNSGEEKTQQFEVLPLASIARGNGLAQVADRIEERARLRERLLWEAEFGSAEGLQKVVAEGASVQYVVDDDGQSVLHITAGRRDAEGTVCCRQLLEADGGDPNVLDYRGRTPLFPAAAVSSQECVQLLLEKRCDVETVDASGETALFSAARNGSSDTGEALLQAGANPDRRSPESGQTVAFWAVDATCPTFLKRLLDTGKLKADDVDCNQRTALFEAKDPECVKMLLERGCSVNASDSHGRTALFTVQGPVITGLLLEAKATVDARDSRQRTALFEASMKRDLAKMLTLIRVGYADGSARDCDGQTALFDCARSAPLEAVKMLVREAFTDPCVEDNLGQTALQVAKRARRTRQAGVEAYLSQVSQRILEMKSLGDQSTLRRRYRIGFDDGETSTSNNVPGSTPSIHFGSKEYLERLGSVLEKMPIWLNAELWPKQSELQAEDEKERVLS